MARVQNVVIPAVHFFQSVQLGQLIQLVFPYGGVIGNPLCTEPQSLLPLQCIFRWRSVDTPTVK